MIWSGAIQEIACKLSFFTLGLGAIVSEGFFYAYSWFD
jgi:hypothetical protein